MNEPGARGVRRGLTLLLATAVLALATAPGAWAHDQLVGPTPKDKSTVDKPLTEVRFQFSAKVNPSFGVATVTEPDGNRWESGEIKTAGTTLIVPLRPVTKAGGYTVGYRVVSSDGHPITGKIAFEVLPAALAATEPPVTSSAAASSASSSTPVPSSTPAAAPAEDGDTGWITWLVLGAVVLAATVAAAFVLRRVRRP
ncbi:copper resistance protein CopC [Crossiella sp. CA-258035]|uniref:copper resistance CopC family protein n=1 Tax=Crossiella sp. CA-258035 TaxID=2981138 RepID=UPI0024BD3228|nr:copper resistance CopC family protein [Crossiella sp. CA-258035]WHT23380.1 copper resistance protein CopC [Crossiella sp. CA-258035]